jgi:protein-tyrosine phosphatase
LHLLFLCTGNICRSPTAAAIARAEIARAGYAGIEVSSAGIAALVGSGATRDASIVAAENGLSLADHRARQLTADLLATVDLVVGMQPHHTEYARRLGAQDATTLSGPVRDPYGLGLDAYHETWALLSVLVPALLTERRAAA